MSLHDSYYLGLLAVHVFMHWCVIDLFSSRWTWPLFQQIQARNVGFIPLDTYLKTKMEDIKEAECRLLARTNSGSGQEHSESERKEEGLGFVV